MADTNLPTFFTDRMTLRPLEMDDAPAVLGYAADPSVSQYTLWSAHRDLEDSRTFIRWLTGSGVWCWALVPECEHAVIGMCFLHSIQRQHKRAEIAFNLARPYWGRGLATEAVRAVLEVSFSTYSFNRIEGNCMIGNVAAGRVMEKCGMSFEGVLRQFLFAKDAFHDARLYAILRDEWDRNRNEG